jgi:hypothetical protein
MVIGHVNNVMYNRYAESARVNWTRNFAASDPVHKKQWMELITPKGVGLILRSITTDYKFVSGFFFWSSVMGWMASAFCRVSGIDVVNPPGTTTTKTAAHLPAQ